MISTTDRKFLFLLTEEEYNLFPRKEECELFPPGHPLAKRWQSPRRKKQIWGVISPEKFDDCRQFHSIPWFDVDNPIIHEPFYDRRYLTHYIFDKDQAIVGEVYFDRSIRGGEYQAILKSGKIWFETCGQTSLLTSDQIQEKEEFSDNEYQLYPIQINHLY